MPARLYMAALSIIIPISQVRKQKPGVVNSVPGHERSQWHCCDWCLDPNALNSRVSPMLPSERLSSPGCPITLSPLLEEETRGKMEVRGGEVEVKQRWK